MPEGQVLEFTNVTKRFNEVTAVSDFSARVEPGAVTAFLGPNGAGKTTSLRILLGQLRATSGTATIGGTAYAELRQPLRAVGAVLEDTVYRPRRSAARQLTIAAKANGIALARVDEVLAMVGLGDEADSRIGGFSLGMRQRLSVAHALLGDPGALVFDEPANGLDPEGIRWMRLLMRRLADEGRTVLVSSHVLSEVEQVADHVLVLSKGRLVLSSGIETLADPAGGAVIVDAADRAALTTALAAAGFDIEVLRSGLTVRGGDAGTVGAVAAEAGIALSTLVQRGPTLEDVFIDLMRGGRFGTVADSPAALETPSTAGLNGAEIAGAGVAAAVAAGGAAALADDLTIEGAADDAIAAAEENDFDNAGFADAAGEADAEENAASAPVANETPDLPSDESAAATVNTLPTDAEDSGEAVSSTPLAEPSTTDAPVDPTSSDESDLASEARTADEAVTYAQAADAPDDAAPAEDASHDTSNDGAPGEEPAKSFDEILFGASAAVAAARIDHADQHPRRSFATLFAAQQADKADDSDAVSPADEYPAPAIEEDPTVTHDHADGWSGDGTTTNDVIGDEAARSTDDETQADDEHAGVEFFAGLDASRPEDAPVSDDDNATDEGSADDSAGARETHEHDDAAAEGTHEHDDAERTHEHDEQHEAGDHGADDTAGDDDSDPRAAAVSSMLAAAARAYYEDEPRDYPLADAAPSSSEDTAADGAHWSVASTGVIDTVPLHDTTSTEFGSDSVAPNTGAADLSDTDHHDDGESRYDGEQPSAHSDDSQGGESHHDQQQDESDHPHDSEGHEQESPHDDGSNDGQDGAGHSDSHDAAGNDERQEGEQHSHDSDHSHDSERRD